MSELDANIHGYSQGAIQGPSFIPPVQEPAEENQVDSGASSIEKSSQAASLMVPSLNFPILFPPSSDTKPLALLVASIENSGAAILEFFKNYEEIKNETINEILDKWNKNLEEIQNYVRDIINSPAYQAVRDIKIHGDPAQGKVSGVESPAAANSAAANPSAVGAASFTYLNSLDRIRTFETSESSKNTAVGERDSNTIDVASVTMLTASIVAGGLALTSTEITPSNVMFSQPVELVERLQPMIPQINAAEIIPMINLMLVLPLYSNALNEAIGNKREREGENHTAAIQNFAKDVLKMVSDPAYVMVSFVNKMDGADQMSPQHKEQVGAMLRLILASVALSLLYSVEVGKVQGGKFWGMEAQEFKDLLLGNISTDAGGQKTEHQLLTSSLIAQVRAQLDLLPASEKERVVETLLGFVGSKHDLKSMMDPAKVLNETFASHDPTKEIEIQSV
ncbi:MAG: hypothetical protein LW832_04205 [Parachlamydia sp.]|jgi:hypothetical protein|nr:hypothetical protein [Parachlamydia sp.]